MINVGSGNKYSVPDFVKIIQKILKQKVKVIWEKNSLLEKYSFLYKSKIKFDQKLIEKEVKKKVALKLNKVKKIYNWKADYNIDRGLMECILTARKILKIK